MNRRPLDARRLSITSKLSHHNAVGGEIHVIATFGLDGRGKIREVMCSSFKDGMDLRALVMDTCICVSLLLQHGYDAHDLRAKLTPAPHSLLATLIDEAIKIEEGRK